MSNWITAFGTLVLAVVAIFQESIKALVYRPQFRVSVKTEPPDCVAVPFGPVQGTPVDSYYVRLWIENKGNATARNVEVYAHELRRKRADGQWGVVKEFPPMNLKWANVGLMYFPRIAPKMGKHCDLAHVADPKRRDLLKEEPALRLGLSTQQTPMAFDLVAAPNHRGHIVGPGEYQLDIRVAAENASPLEQTVAISLSGTWYSDEATMWRDGIGVSVVASS